MIPCVMQKMRSNVSSPKLNTAQLVYVIFSPNFNPNTMQTLNAIIALYVPSQNVLLCKVCFDVTSDILLLIHPQFNSLHHSANVSYKLCLILAFSARTVEHKISFPSLFVFLKMVGVFIKNKGQITTFQNIIWIHCTMICLHQYYQCLYITN